MALPTPLVDAEARNRVTTELATSLFVEAGAGSGKTTALVQRIVRLVRSGVPVTRIAAITFTEAAAAELRHRVRAELEWAGAEQRDQTLLNAAGQVESAAFTTLHGFALRLLSDHPVAAGLPPGFAVADEIASLLDFDEHWRLFLGQVGDDLDLLELQERSAVLGVELRRFVDVARRFDDNWDLLADIDRKPPELKPLDLDDLLAAVVEVGGLVEHCLDPEDRLARPLAALAAEADDLAGAGAEPLDQLEWLLALKWPPRNGGRKDRWTGLDVAEVRRRVQATRDLVDGRMQDLRAEIIAQWVVRVADFVDDRVTARRQRGELAFHDLLVLARRLLRSNDTVRQELHQRYTRLLLDEFQDTDPIQIELAVLLCASGEVGDTDWQELLTTLEPGRLVVVGDPKQSIYRFRRADIAVYADTEAGLVEESTRLVTNFRSVPGVVEWVNAAFGHLIGAGEPGAQPAFTPLAPHREPDPAAVTEQPVVVLGGPHPSTTPVGEIRQLEAADVAAVICRAMAEGWRTERDGHWTPLRLQDIAVLIPSRLSLPALEAALGAANVPFRPETTSLVYATQEVREVMAAVRAVATPTASIDVVAALRSAVFAVGDDDLLAWHRAGGSWDYRTIDLDRPSDHPVAEAFAVLRAWHHERWWLAPSALIERIVIERRLREAALAEPRPRDRWRRYRFLAEQARQFTATQGGDLTDFVAWVEIQSSDLARVTEPIPAEPDDDAVRVLTVHGSKGLEFPMVILAGAPTQDQSRTGGPQVLFPRQGAPQVKVGAGRATTGFDVHASVEEVLDQHERLRLHYVAATRARDLLVVSAHHKEGGRSSMGRRTFEALEHGTAWTRFEADGDEHYEVEPPTQLRLGEDGFDRLEREWTTEQRRLLARNEETTVFSATGLAERLRIRHAGSLLVEPETTGELPLGAAVGTGTDATAQARVAIDGLAVAPAADQGRMVPLDDEDDYLSGEDLSGDDETAVGDGAAIGTAVHGVLEVVDVGRPTDLEPLARYQAAKAGASRHLDRIVQLVGQALAAPSLQLARDHRHWKELYVAAPFGEHVLEGFIDLCIETDDGYLIVDYKTDRVDDADDLAAKVDHYGYQAASYALALEHITGSAVSECRLVFISTDGVTEAPVPDLDRLRDQVRADLL